MKQILVQIDDRMAAQLEKVAPGRSHKRSAFVRQALAKALQEELERKTRAAYERWPDEPVEVDPRAWAPEAETMHPEVEEEPKKTRGRATKAQAGSRSSTKRPHKTGGRR